MRLNWREASGASRGFAGNVGARASEPPISGPRASGAAELVSEDLNHGQDYDGVKTINPFVPV